MQPLITTPLTRWFYPFHVVHSHSQNLLLCNRSTLLEHVYSNIFHYSDDLLFWHTKMIHFTSPWQDQNYWVSLETRGCVWLNRLVYSIINADQPALLRTHTHTGLECVASCPTKFQNDSFNTSIGISYYLAECCTQILPNTLSIISATGQCNYLHPSTYMAPTQARCCLAGETTPKVKNPGSISLNQTSFNSLQMRFYFKRVLENIIKQQKSGSVYDEEETANTLNIPSQAVFYSSLVIFHHNTCIFKQYLWTMLVMRLSKKCLINLDYV